MQESANYDWEDLADNGKVRFIFRLSCVRHSALCPYTVKLLMVFALCFVWQLKDLTVTELKYYLSAHKLAVGGKKEALISRILSHMNK